MSGRETLERVKTAHFLVESLGGGTTCRRCFSAWPCDTVRLIAALEEALARMDCSGGHCGEQCHVCDDRDAVLDKLTAGEV